MADNRKSHRIIFRRQVLINNLIGATGLDLSISGIYIHTGRHFITGSIVNIALPLDNVKLELKARVQHSKHGVGMGLEFMDLKNEQKRVLADFIKRHIEEITSEKSDERKKALIIDENDAARRLYRSKLVLEGFTVFEAEDSASAMAKIETEKIDVVVYMSGGEGFGLLSSIRQMPGMEKVPILVVSAKSSPGASEAAVQAGATEFMAKIFTSPVKLAERIKARLKYS